MANIISVIWDFDKTLIPGYMQAPIFDKFNVPEKTFWDEVNALPEKYEKEQGIRVNRDTIYLNHILEYTKNGTFKNLSNEMLLELGGKLEFYPGVDTFLVESVKQIKDNPAYNEYDIKLEHYIVSTGLSQMIWGSKIAMYVDGIWGCDFIEKVNQEGINEISEISYTMDNTTKTKAIFEINKGVGLRDGVEVNTKLPDHLRRIPFENMIYIADGPSDIPAFSLINKSGGVTFAVYPPKDERAFEQVERLRRDGRVNMYAEADYRPGTTANLFIMSTVKKIANRIIQKQKELLAKSISPTPIHLI